MRKLGTSQFRILCFPILFCTGVKHGFSLYKKNTDGGLFNEI